MTPSKRRFGPNPERFSTVSVSSLTADKDALRRRFRRTRKALDHDRRVSAEHAITTRLLQLVSGISARMVAVYASHRSEASIDEACAKLGARGIVLGFPRVEDRSLVFHRVSGLSDLTAGFRGIREPRPDTPQIAPDAFGIVVMPGLAFDRTGGRLGQGGGFYDRFLEGIPETVVRIGVGFACQIASNALPMSSDDRRVDAVVTEVETVLTQRWSPGASSAF